jgi:hypothetical protein
MDTSSIVILAAAVFITLLYAGYIYGKKRSGAFHEFARRRGLSFSRSADIDLAREFPGFHVFLQGTGQTVSNLVKGESDGCRIMLFDYQCTAGSGPSSTTQNETILLMQSGKLSLPSFQLYPENIFNRIFSALGKQDINFQSRPEFSNSYVLRGDAGDEVRNAFTDQALAYFANHKGLNVEGIGRHILLYRYNTLVKPEDIQSFLTGGLEVLRLFEKGPSE